ncbi:hypothetical protein PSE_3298 [Pseudovibrio sp. FO-BEG1]|nr:hypothetical protein PSE_3298 [Pseudovibrio sp. FO-BEG1]EEA96850.1 hypothetical protein PJE062_1689 [Pseudovibrio sp. JE062]
MNALQIWGTYLCCCGALNSIQNTFIVCAQHIKCMLSCSLLMALAANAQEGFNMPVKPSFLSLKSVGLSWLSIASFLLMGVLISSGQAYAEDSLVGEDKLTQKINAKAKDDFSKSDRFFSLEADQCTLKIYNEYRSLCELPAQNLGTNFVINLAEIESIKASQVRDKVLASFRLNPSSAKIAKEAGQKLSRLYKEKHEKRIREGKVDVGPTEIVYEQTIDEISLVAVEFIDKKKLSTRSFTSSCSGRTTYGAPLFDTTYAVLFPLTVSRELFEDIFVLKKRCAQ